MKIALRLLLIIPFCCTNANAQDGSLLRQGNSLSQVQSTRPSAANAAPQATNRRANPMTGAVQVPSGSTAPGGISVKEASWIYEPPLPNRVYRMNDIVTIRVDEIFRSTAEGNSESRKNTLYDAILQSWLRFDGLDTIKPAVQADGDPRVQGATNQLYRADASLESRQSVSFNIAARIVDIRPNGDLVLEARKSIVQNDNVWETALTGSCRPIDIATDNVVLSKDLLDLDIKHHQRGRLYDGYKRGWFTRWLETLNPF